MAVVVAEASVVAGGRRRSKRRRRSGQQHAGVVVVAVAVAAAAAAQRRSSDAATQRRSDAATQRRSDAPPHKGRPAVEEHGQVPGAPPARGKGVGPAGVHERVVDAAARVEPQAFPPLADAARDPPQELGERHEARVGARGRGHARHRLDGVGREGEGAVAVPAAGAHADVPEIWVVADAENRRVCCPGVRREPRVEAAVAERRGEGHVRGRPGRVLAHRVKRLPQHHHAVCRHRRAECPAVGLGQARPRA